MSELHPSPVLDESLCSRLWTRPIFAGPFEGTPRMGLEMEFFAYDSKTKAPLGTPGAALNPQDLLQRLHTRCRGSELAVDPSTGVLVGLKLPNGANWSLEPGGQVEFSSAPHARLEDVAQEVTAHLDALARVSNGDVTFVSHGTNPHPIAEMPLVVPKSRYRMMTRYYSHIPERRGLHMMRSTGTVQPNLDIPGGQAEWQDAVRLCLALTPFAQALFANSRFFHGHPSNGFSERQSIWAAHDPSRSGIPTGLFLAEDVACRYAQWGLEAQVFALDGVKPEDQPLPGSLSFAQWMQGGWQGTRPTLSSWEKHLGTLFPELRLRGFLEVRSTDAQPFDHLLAPLAFWSLLLQSEAGRAAGWAWVDGLLAGLTTAPPQVFPQGLSRSKSLEALVALPRGSELFTNPRTCLGLLDVAKGLAREHGSSLALASLSAYSTHKEFGTPSGETALHLIEREGTQEPGITFAKHLDLKRKRACCGGDN